MAGTTKAGFDGVELDPSFGKTQKRWRQLYTKLRSTRALLSLSKEYTVVEEEPDYFFRINQSNLGEIVRQKNLDQLLQIGSVGGVATALKTNEEDGIIGDAEDTASRQKIFGSNSYLKPPAKTSHLVMNIVLEAFKDLIILVLLAYAALAIGFGIKKHQLKGLSYGGSIIVAVFLVIAISALSNFWPKKEFSKLSQALDSVQVDVMRNGQRRQIPIFDVVVGDVICLEIGDQVPADGLFLDGNSLRVDESGLTAESDPVKVNHDDNPFLLSGSKVVDGHARMLVTAVGMNTEWGQIMRAISSDSDEKTPLQAKLKKLTLFIAKGGVLVAFLVFVILLIRYFTGNMHDDNGRREFNGGKTNFHDVCNDVLGMLATPVAIAAAAIPEGLLLAVLVTLAFSIMKMRANHAFVKRLSACEAMASVTVICTDKRGTLTVTEFWLGLKEIKRGSSSPIVPKALALLHQGVGLNEICHPSGYLSEVSKKAINEWAEEIGMNIEEQRNSCDILHVEPFNSEKKQSSVLIRKKADKTIHVHQTGAPEVILAECSQYHDVTGDIKEIDNDAYAELQRITQGMVKNGLQCIAFAHKQMAQGDDYEGKFTPDLEDGCLTLLGIVGLTNPVREAVRDCRSAGVDIKMITGDGTPTAKTIASECGIIELNQDTNEGEVVEGAEFRNYTDQERVEKVDRIRVVARATSLHKLLMVQCLKQKGHVVAVTGDGTGDAVAFRRADVGISMGIESTDMAKECSGVFIPDNNFASVVEVLWWGRGIYINIQKFTQFQLAVSLASLLVDFIIAISAAEPPTINIVTAISAGKVPYATLQVLWVKLIMGTLSALALTLEQPTKEVMQKTPINFKEPFITNIMWRNVLAQALYQIAVLLTIQFKGESIFSINTKVKDTMIFNTFVLLQIFTLFNAKKFEGNVIEQIQKKKLFWGIIGLIIVLQVVMVEFLKRFADTERLCWRQWGACVGIAAVSCLVSWLVKYIPVPKKPFFSYLRMQNLTNAYEQLLNL